MPKTATDLADELNRLKLDLADVRKAMVNAGKQAKKLKVSAGDRKKLAEVKSAIDQIYKNIK